MSDTGPVRPLSAMSDTDLLVLQADEARKEFKKAQALYLAVLRGEPRPAVELIHLASRMAELEWAVRKAVTFELAGPVLDSPPLAAVPPAQGRGRHRAPTGAGRRPLMNPVQDERREATVTWLPGAGPAGESTAG